MKTLKIILKGILFYITTLVIIFAATTIDSYNSTQLNLILFIVAILCIACKMFISKRDFIKITYPITEKYVDTDM